VNGKGEELLVSSNSSLLANLKFFDRQQEKQFSLFWEIHMLIDKVNMIKITGDRRFPNKICTANIK
jgi:hypothetical protein